MRRSSRSSRACPSLAVEAASEQHAGCRAAARSAIDRCAILILVGSYVYGLRRVVSRYAILLHHAWFVYGCTCRVSVIQSTVEQCRSEVTTTELRHQNFIHSDSHRSACRMPQSTVAAPRATHSHSLSLEPRQSIESHEMLVHVTTRTPYSTHMCRERRRQRGPRTNASR